MQPEKNFTLQENPYTMQRWISPAPVLQTERAWSALCCKYTGNGPFISLPHSTGQNLGMKSWSTILPDSLKSSCRVQVVLMLQLLPPQALLVLEAEAL